MLEKYNEKGGFAQGVFNFVQAIKPGDIVLATEKQGKVLGIGRVIGGYYFDNQSRVSHRINVEWLSQDSWNLPNDEVRNQVIREMTSPDNLVETETRIIGLSPIIKTNPPEKPIITLSGIPVRINEILERKRQVILYGPPGTGKTHWAYQSAINIASINNYKIEFSGLSEEQKKTLLGNEKHQGLIRMCTFHPSYGYEDFIEGYRPKSNNGILIFELHSGIFKQLCIDARQQTNQKFFLIIDEINRGDIPRIFGELLTILEKDKRGREIILPVSGDNFSVPDNVYIIGTMNTADRSIALLDTALRRRFGFIELMPDSSILGNIVLQSIPLASWLDALNNRILKSIGRDSRNLQIGHAYLLENGHPLTDFTRFTRVLQDDIIPLLEEYCYEDYDALEKILGKGLVDREKQKINHELFEPSHRDDLIQALLEPSPEITTTSAAVQQDQTEIIEEEETEDQT
jgi:5-methylcytosine-specific restriction protein B